MSRSNFLKLIANRVAHVLPELKHVAKIEDVVKSDQILVQVIKKNPTLRGKLLKYLTVGTGVSMTATALVALLELKQKQMTGCFRYEFDETSDGPPRICKVAHCSCNENAPYTSEGIPLCAPDELLNIQKRAKCWDSSSPEYTPCVACDMISLADTGELPSNVLYMCQAPSKLEVVGLLTDWAATETKSVFGKVVNTALGFAQTIIKIIPFMVLGGSIIFITFLFIKYNNNGPVTTYTPLYSTPNLYDERSKKIQSA